MEMNNKVFNVGDKVTIRPSLAGHYVKAENSHDYNYVQTMQTGVVTIRAVHIADMLNPVNVKYKIEEDDTYGYSAWMFIESYCNHKIGDTVYLSDNLTEDWDCPGGYPLWVQGMRRGVSAKIIEVFEDKNGVSYKLDTNDGFYYGDWMFDDNTDTADETPIAREPDTLEPKTDDDFITIASNPLSVYEFCKTNKDAKAYIQNQVNIEQSALMYRAISSAVEYFVEEYRFDEEAPLSSDEYDKVVESVTDRYSDIIDFVEDLCNGCLSSFINEMISDIIENRVRYFSVKVHCEGDIEIKVKANNAVDAKDYVWSMFSFDVYDHIDEHDLEFSVEDVEEEEASPYADYEDAT